MNDEKCEFQLEVARRICDHFTAAPGRTLEGKKLLACWLDSGRLSVIFYDMRIESVRGMHVGHFSEYCDEAASASGGAFLVLHAEVLAPGNFQSVLSGPGTPIGWAFIDGRWVVPASIESIWGGKGEVKPPEERVGFSESAEILCVFPLRD